METIMIIECTNKTPLGPVRVAAEDEQLIGLWFSGQKYEPPQWVEVSSDSSPLLQSVVQWLNDYFTGRAKKADFAMNPRGSEFQRRVWQQLCCITSGEKCRYGALANAIGRPEAARASAAAIGRNPISILIPCHRVIGTSGALTGYAGGLGRKRALLALEAGQGLPWRTIGQSYNTQYKDPIRVNAGERVRFIDRADDGEFAGWKWAQATDGRGGWVPQVYFGPNDHNGYAHALRSYSARELDVGAGDQILELDQFSGWLWVIDRKGSCGWIPETVVVK